MTRRILITRPRNDAEPLARELRARGIDTLIQPMMTVETVPGPSIDVGGVQAVLATSANGVRALATRCENRSLPLFAVGDATARTATALGFEHVESAGGDVEDLAALVVRRLDSREGSLLHAAGTALAGDLAGSLNAAGFAYRREVLYEARAIAALPPAAIEAIRAATLDGVALFSPRTARILVDLTASAGLASAVVGLTAYCLSPAVAERARRLSWRAVVVASRPETAALVDAIAGEQPSSRLQHFVSPERNDPC